MPDPPMKILFLQKRAHKAGVQVCLLRTVRALAEEMETEPKVLMGEEGWLTSELRKINALAGVVPFPSLRSPLSRWFQGNRFARRAHEIDRKYGPFHLIHVSDTWDALIGESVSQGLKIPWAVHLRSILTPENPAEHYYKYHCDRADAVIAISVPVYDLVRNWDHGSLACIPEGLSETDFREPRETNIRFPESIGVIGHGGELKGWSDLSTAFRKVAQGKGTLPRKITFIGPVERAREEGIRKSLPGDIEVVFTGRVDDIISCAREADLVIAPSRSESFGMAMLETIAAGIPLLASYTGVASHIMGKGSPWTFSPGDPDSIVAAWTRLPALWQNYGPFLEEWQRRLRSEFLIHSTTRSLVRLYQKILLES